MKKLIVRIPYADQWSLSPLSTQQFQLSSSKSNSSNIPTALTKPDAVVACCSRGTQQATTAGESQPVMVKAISAYSTTEVFTWRVPLWSMELWWVGDFMSLTSWALMRWHRTAVLLLASSRKGINCNFCFCQWNASYCRTLQVDKSNTLNYLTIVRYFIHWR